MKQANNQSQIKSTIPSFKLTCKLTHRGKVFLEEVHYTIERPTPFFIKASMELSKDKTNFSVKELTNEEKLEWQ